MNDLDLDDAALWASVDTVAEASRRALPKPPSPAILCPDNDPHRGEVLQPARPFKLPRLTAHGHATPPPPSPSPSHPPPYMTPDASRRLMVVQSPQPEPAWVMEHNAASPAAAGCFPAHGLSPSSSVANFKKYQEVAVSILDKSDWTLISGNPYLKKSGWRKLSCFFNISFEIKDHSIEFDDSRNVNSAAFLVRASMQFSDGWGSCDRREKRFNKPNNDIPSTAETRAKNKACQDLLGIGNYRPG
ncbi:hypothetical protein BRADI_1g61440v3 [Brachypodium distachyon]|uniref:Uncharacterized protein n=1 Tax=Brachypodium distachyon TaxID=15368 RepID=A0A0Q3LF05_BRADI|nr:hypothetical protein BRADI_1g61440v3 [Brachypodium distachyon]